MKVYAKVQCYFTIEYENDETDIDITQENIEMSTVQDLINYETEDSIQIINVRNIEEV